MRNIIFTSIVCSLFLGCVASSPVRPKDLTYRLIESNRTIGYQIESNSLEYDIEILAECSSSNKKYSLNFVEKGTSKNARNPQWSFFYNGKKNYLSSTVYDEKNYLRNVAQIQTARYLGQFKYSKKIELTSPKLNQLPELCGKKHDRLVLTERNKSQQKRDKDKKLIDSVAKKTGLSPMLTGDNQTSLNELVYDFQRNGYSQHKNKFVWVTDGDYRVSQVLNDKVMLTSYNSSLPPITIVTKLPALEGQFWSKISRSPLKLIGATNYKTILGAQKQTIVFQQL